MRQIPKQYLVKEQDIREHDGIHVHTPSPFAKENLFCVHLDALYTCGPLYDVQRQDLDSFLFFFIKEGMLRFEYDGKTFTAAPGDVIFLDCRRHHRYRAMGTVRFYWFHADGCATGAYFSQLSKTKGVHFPDSQKLEEHFVRIHDMMRGGFPDEGMLSVQVHQILASLSAPAGKNGILSDNIARARLYMDEHYMESVSTEDIARISHMSPSHFYRLFRKETGLTPHGYLMNVRLNHAMSLLLETPFSVEEIAEQCAFCSSANFIRAFRASTGTTPHRFRTLVNGMTSSM